MRFFWNAGVVLWLGIGGATEALAQSWTITIGTDQKIASTTLKTGQVNIVTDSQATVTATCPSGVDCTQVALRLTLNNVTISSLTPTSQSAASSAFAIPKSGVSNGTSLVVTFAGTNIGTFLLGPDAGATPGTMGNQAPPSSAPTLADLLALPCPGTYTAGYVEPPAKWWKTSSSQSAEGEIVVTPLGVVLASGLDTSFDENDVLVVTVVADKRLLPLLTIERTSPFRDVTSVQILGAGQTAPTLERQAGLVADCGTRELRLEDFAPGQGTVQISALQGTTTTQIGTFDFNVNPLYSGAMTLGAARTQVVDPGFKLASVDGQTVIAVGDEGDDDLIYTLFYTPFVWGQWDIQKSVPWVQHLNPTIGVAPEDVADNAFVGVTADLPAGIALTWGWHFRRIETLTQGLTVGSPFTGTADQLPTAEEWENDQFWAVSIDLRAMVQVLRAALGTGGGS